MTCVADYLRGYVAGYWEGWDFGHAAPTVDDYLQAELLERAAAPSGGADASSAAPAPELGVPRASAGGLEQETPAPSPGACAASSLPAIRQSGLPGDVDVAGTLEGLYVHRGMVVGLSMMVELFDKLGMVEAKRMCEGAIFAAKEDVRGIDS